jgi:hypothetical protein
MLPNVYLLEFFCIMFLTLPTLIKKKTKFSSYIRDLDGIGCKVIYDEGLPNIWGNIYIWLCTRSVFIFFYMRKIFFSFLSVHWENKYRGAVQSWAVSEGEEEGTIEQFSFYDVIYKYSINFLIVADCPCHPWWEHSAADPVTIHQPGAWRRPGIQSWNYQMPECREKV